jgi:lysophospholipase L1-like esterase
MIWLSIILLIVFGTAFLLGYTTIRFPVKREEGKQHIACIGDSITYGCAIPVFFRRCYPAVLQKMLGPETQVISFGVNDRTLQDTGNRPYRKEKAFRQSLAYLPDTVVILLGTNDSKDRNWISEEVFLQQYREMIAEYRRLSSRPRILACTPPCAFRPDNRFFLLMNDVRPDRIPQIADLVRSVAAETGAGLVDLYALTEGRRELFAPDGIHPSAKGAEVIAEAVCQKIRSSACAASDGRPDNQSVDKTHCRLRS